MNTFSTARLYATLLASIEQNLTISVFQIDPKRAIPREEHLRNTRYFVGGLSHATTSDSMRAFFSQYGKVVDCTVMVDRESGRSKGFGFVTFEDASNTDQLVGQPNLILDDKQVHSFAFLCVSADSFLICRSRSRLHNHAASAMPHAQEAVPGAKTHTWVARMSRVPAAAATAAGWALAALQQALAPSRCRCSTNA